MLYRLFTLRMQGSASNLERAVPCVTLRNYYVESLLDDVGKHISFTLLEVEQAGFE